MSTVIKCPKDNQRLFNMTINGKKDSDMKLEFKFEKEIEIKCPKCGGIVAVKLNRQGMDITMKTLGNTGRKRRYN